jgi:hypothetical protein
VSSGLRTKGRALSLFGPPLLATGIAHWRTTCPASLLIFPQFFTITKLRKTPFTSMDIGFSSRRAPIFVTHLWMNLQAIDFTQDKKREKLFDLNSEESKFTLVL